MNKNDAGSGTQSVDEKIDALRDTVKGLVDQGAQKVEEIRSKVVEVKDEAVTRGSAVLDRMTTLIKAHPIRAVAMAFGVGYIATRLFRR